MPNKYYRFMSEDEFSALINGEELVNHNRHTKYRTESVGFCFLGPDSIAYGLRGPYGIEPGNEPVSAYRIVGGCCGSEEIFVEFEGKSIKESGGVYADYSSEDWDDCVLIKEYCTENYNSAILKPLRAWRKTGGNYGYDPDWEQISFIALDANLWKYENRYEYLMEV